MRGCKAVDVNGNVVMRFASLTDAAYSMECPFIR